MGCTRVLCDFLPRGEGAVAEHLATRSSSFWGGTERSTATLRPAVPSTFSASSFRFTYGTFYRYEGNGQITVLADFFDQRKPPMRCAAADDGFYVVSDRHLMHLGFDGTKTILADFTSGWQNRFGLTGRSDQYSRRRVWGDLLRRLEWVGLLLPLHPG